MSNDVSTTEETRRVLSAFYSAGERGDFAALMQCMDENIVIHEPPFLPYGGTYTGIADFQQKIVAGLAPYGDLTKITVRRLVVEGERGFCVVEIPQLAGGGSFQLVEESRVRNGKMVEMRIYYFDAGSMLRT